VSSQGINDAGSALTAYEGMGYWQCVYDTESW
jgi:hypothetical protein